MSLYVKDLKMWSLSLACALNNNCTHKHVVWSYIQIHSFCDYFSFINVLMFDAENALESMLETSFFFFFEKLRNDPSFTEDLSLRCLHSIWILKCEWVPASSWRPARTGIVRARGPATPLSRDEWNTAWTCAVPQALATLQYRDRADKIMNDQFRCAMHCQRHTPHSHKAISWQVLVV